MSQQLSIILGAPGEAEMPLLADLGARDDVAIVAVIDPTGEALGASIAEIMGLPVVPSLDDLAQLQNPLPLFVLPAEPGSLVAQLSAAAVARGLTTIRTDELRARLFQQSAAPTPPPPERPAPSRPGLEEIEQESAAIQDALAGLEDALAGDTILRRLLDLCTRAVGAGGGSIMLFDETSRELYIAYATGLSEGTMHSTRVKLGEGIAGRVARTRQAELVEGAQGTARRHRDRPDITSAVCAPLVAGNRLLGVLNVSCQAGEAQLDGEARDLLVGLGVRLGRILDGVQQLQQQRTSRIFSLTEQQLRRLAGDNPELPDMFTAWTEALAVTAEADRVSLVVPCADGSLLTCESAAGEMGAYRYETLHNPAWIEVLTSAVPMVARQDDLSGAGGPPVTVFYLPVGRTPVRAGLSVHFTNSRAAHAFHALAGETVFLLERLLPDQVDRRRQEHRAGVLEDLSVVLGELAAHDGTPGRFGEDLGEAARRMTGAVEVAVVAELLDGRARLAGGNAPEGASWLNEIPRLVEAAAADGWRITTLETGSDPVSVLVAVGDPGVPVPALVLVGKERQHSLDGKVFTPQDAEMVVPLAGLLGRLQPVKPEEPVAPGPVMGTEPLAGETLAVELGTAAFDVDIDGQKNGEEALLLDLRRELDRCDRYHNVCGLVILKPELPEIAAFSLLEAAARRVVSSLRISDRVFTLPDGSLAVMVPENVQHLDQLQSRLVADLRDLAGDPDLPVMAARAAYPATKGPADAMVERIRSRMVAVDVPATSER